MLWAGIAIVPGFVAIARRNARRAAAVVACAAAPLVLYAYLPIRSAVVEASHVDRAANDPIDFTGEIAWDTNRPDTPRGFLTEVTGSEFRAAQTLGAVFFVGRYADFAAKWASAAAFEFGPVPLVLAAIAIVVPFVRRRPPAPAHVAVWIASLAALPFTYSYTAEVDVTRYVSASLAVALALAASAGSVLPNRRLGAAVVCLLLAVPLYSEYRNNGYLIRERGNPDNRNTLSAVTANTPPDATCSPTGSTARRSHTAPTSTGRSGRERPCSSLPTTPRRTRVGRKRIPYSS